MSNSLVAWAYRLHKSMYKLTQRDGGLSVGQQSQAHDLESFEALQEIRYDTRCYFNVRSKANISQPNLPKQFEKNMQTNEDM